MKKLATLTVLFTAQIIFPAQDTGCKPCSEDEARTFEQRFKDATPAARFLHLKMLIAQEDASKPWVFAQMRALFCSLRLEENYHYECRYNIFSRMLRGSGWWYGLEPKHWKPNGRCCKSVCVKSYRQLYELLKLAIEHNAQALIPFIYSTVAPQKINVQEVSLCDKWWYRENKLPTDLEILADSVETHEDPANMAYELLKFRTPEEELFTENVKKPCRDIDLESNPKKVAYCKFIREAVRQWGTAENKQFQAALAKIAADAFDKK